MPNGGQYNLPFDNDDLTALERFFAKVFADPRTLKTLMDQSGLPPETVDPGGDMPDRWAQVVRECYERNLLPKLIDAAAYRLAGKMGSEEGLAQIIESIQQRQAGVDGKDAIEAIEQIRGGLERLWELQDPTEGRQIAQEIRGAVLTIRRMIEDGKTIPYAIVGVGVVPESGLATLERIIRTCMDVVSSVDRLLGTIQLAEDSLDRAESLTEGSRDSVLRLSSLLDVKIDARGRLVGSIRRFLRVIEQDVALAPSPSRPRAPNG